MISIIDKYIAKQVIVACVLAILILSGPTIVISLFKHLPSDAILSEFFLPSLYGIACMILYVTLPVPIAVAIVWIYSQLSSDGVLPVLYSAGISILGVRAPAFFVAACATALGYAMSCYLAPYTANNIHDMLFSLRYDILPVLLREGKFNEIDHGRQVIFFKRRLSDKILSDVFIREVTDDQQVKAYTARWIVFVRDGDDSRIVLHDGSMLIMDSNRNEVRSVAFDRIVRPATRSGVSPPRRGEIFYDEITGADFLRAAPAAFHNPTWAREWSKEAVKRFGFPALTIIHTFLGLELLALWSRLGARVRYPTVSVCALIMALHFAIAVTAENVSRFNAWFAWVVVMLMITELGVAVLIALFRSGRLMTPAALREEYSLPAGDPFESAPDAPEMPKRQHAEKDPVPTLAHSNAGPPIGA